MVNKLVETVKDMYRHAGNCHRRHKSRETITSLLSCGSDLYQKYRSGGGVGDLEGAISLNQQALGLCPVGHPDRASTLNNLGNCMESRYESQGALGDLEEAISLHQEALGLHPVGHPDRSMSLNNLGNCMQSRYESQGALGDLEEAISLHQEVLGLRPVGHPDRASTLNNLGNCMESRYESQGALGDLEETISLFHQALDLCIPGSTMQASIASKLASSFEHRFRHTHMISDKLKSLQLQQDIPETASCTTSSLLPLTIFPTTSQLISNVIQNILHSVPPRLLQTSTGTLFTLEQIRVQFYQSPQYETLVTSLQQNCDWYSNLKYIQTSIPAYFQYVTLSHKWGVNEPSLQDILDKGSIYEMLPTEGLVKLQKFCDTAAHHGYSWAWSDTCCIDKTNSVDVQEAIGSMFSWYRQSALTIVHLADISPSSVGTLSNSVWFRRGWTLQELLAPNTILFYTQDWSIYMNSTAANHKKDAIIVKELAQATGISSDHLTNFHASMDDARSKLQWAASRHTTRSEDNAYSLFGIFDLHLPVLYGEGKEKALGRLLQEILSQSRDISILHWVGEQSSFHSCFPTDISSYQPLPCVQPYLTDVAIQRSMLRLQRLVSTDDAQKVYHNFINLPGARFANRTLTLPCIAHHVQGVKLRHTHRGKHTYDVQVAGLRPVQIISQETLEDTTELTESPYVLIRPWDRKLINYSGKDRAMAGYKALMRLEQPFIALMLLRLPEGEYKRICASHLIVVRTDNPASIVNSEVVTLDIV